MSSKLIFGVLFIVVFATKCYSKQSNCERTLLKKAMKEILLKEYKGVKTEKGYDYSYKTDDGSVREEVGVIMNPGTDKEELVVMGAYSYEHNKVRTTTMYTADKRGYRARFSILNLLCQSAIG